MSKLINPNDYLKLSSYHEKYDICKRKLYRHINDNNINYILIDGIPFIKDEPSTTLETNNSGRNVKNLTLKEDNVKKLTLNDEQNVQNLTLLDEKPPNLTGNEDLLNVKNLTLKENDNVQNLTFNKRLNELLSIPENKRTIKEFDEIDKISKNLK